MCVWDDREQYRGDPGRGIRNCERQEKMWRERVTEEGKLGRREINQFNKQRASYPRISCTGGIMWFGNLAQRSGS